MVLFTVHTNNYNADTEKDNDDNDVLIFLTSWQAERGFAAEAVFLLFEGRVGF